MIYPFNFEDYEKGEDPIRYNYEKMTCIREMGMNSNGSGTINIQSDTTGKFNVILYTTNGAKKIRLNITVTANGNPDNVVSVKSIKLDKNKSDLKVNDQSVLDSTVSPENATDDYITWTSDKPDVASVNCGVVKGLKNGTAVITATTRDGQKTAKCVVTVGSGSAADQSSEEQKQDSKKTINAVKVGSVVKDSKSKAKYKVLKSSSKGAKSVAFTGLYSKKKTSVNIPDTISINGVKYKVTEVKANALKNNKKVKSVTIGKNVTKIGKNAFLGCKKLKTIKIKSTKLSSKNVGKSAFSKINSKVKVKVPKSKKKAYKKWIYKKGLPKKAKLS